jgi:CHAT domain-containing protein
VGKAYAHKTLILISGFLIAIGSIAQSKDAHALLQEADRLAFLYNWSQAAPIFAEAEKLFEQADDQRNALYARFGRIGGSLETLSLLEISEHLAQQLQDPMLQADSALRLRCLIVKGGIDGEIDPTSARKNWQEVLSLAKNLGNSMWVNRASGELGLVAFIEGDRARAQKLVGDALMTALAAQDFGASLRYLSAIGTGYMLTGYKGEGLPYLERALQLAKNQPEPGFPYLAYWGKIYTLVRLNEKAQALRLAAEALNQAKMSGNRAKEAQLLITNAKLMKESIDDEKFVELLEESLSIAGPRGFRRLTAEANFQLAELYRKRGQYEVAEKYATESADSTESAGDYYFLPVRLGALAEIRALRGDLAAADDLYARATDMVDGFLGKAPSTQSEAALISDFGKLYVDHFMLVADQLKDVPKAVSVLERARGRAAADALRAPAREPATSEEKQAALREISRLRLQLSHSRQSSERKTLLEKILFQEQALAQTNLSHGALYRAISKNAFTDLQIFQNSLRKDEIVLEYVLGDPSSFCLAIKFDRVSCHRLASRKQIEELTGRYLNEIRTTKDNPVLAAELYSLLLKPVPLDKSGSRLIVVADGELHLLPFEALIDSERHYVVESHVVSYSPSATVYQLLRSSARGPRGSFFSYLGMGDVPYGERQKMPLGSVATRGIRDLNTLSSLPPLLDSRTEITTAVQALRGKNVLLLGREATEGALKRLPLDQFRVLHFAVHAVADEQFPDRAGLVLLADPVAGEDGILESREISNLPLNADLVILSACDTAAGRLQGQEGVANLSRSFIFAGAKSVVASLWRVQDEATSQLMKGFLTHLSQQQDKGAALRSAKMDILKKFSGHAPPFYWAGFILQGENDKPVLYRKAGV